MEPPAAPVAKPAGNPGGLCHAGGRERIGRLDCSGLGVKPVVERTVSVLPPAGRADDRTGRAISGAVKILEDAPHSLGKHCPASTSRP